ncbi:hypothetical protein V8C26DRAFT_402624 [Trichoderma gracile]
MRPSSITNAFVFGLLGLAPIASGLSTPAGSTDVERRYVGSPAALASKFVRSIITGLEARHHTEAQIAAKEAAAGKKGGKKHQAREADVIPPDDEFGSWADKRAPHHTEAQIAAKEAAAAKKGDKKHQARHHTEAQIAAKEAAAAKKGGKKHQAREADVIPPDDEFGSWADKRAPHHTEAQIAAKEAAAAKKGGKKHQAREADVVPEDDEFGSWADKRAPHHTEAQIAAKEAAAAKKTGGKKSKGNSN